MIVEDFVFNLTTKFKDKKDEERNKIFADDLATFTNQCKETNLQDVYNYITVNHKFSTPFQVAKIYSYAKDKKYMVESVKKESSVIWWYQCTSCKIEYSKEGRGCPKCRSHNHIIKTGESAPNNMVLVHEDCYYCTIYPESVKKSNEKKAYGATCHTHGTIDNQDRVCGKCECLECCKQMNMYNIDPKGTVEKYKTTELAQPWLMPVPKLDKTAQDMLNHITNRKIQDCYTD